MFFFHLCMHVDNPVISTLHCEWKMMEMIYWCRNTSTVLHVRWCLTHRELHSGWILSTTQLPDRNTHRESKWVETESGLQLTSLTGAATQIQVLKQNSTSGCGHKNLNPRTQCYLIINASHFNPSVAPFSIKIPWAQIIEHIAARNCFGWNQKR